jgi:hypothetical protein
VIRTPTSDLNLMSALKPALFTCLFIIAVCVTNFAQTPETSSNARLDSLIAELYLHPWQGPENMCSPMCWHFNFTEPMLKILEVGQPAQNALLGKLNDPAIKDQVIILLGGVGDERAVGPIIKAMVDQRHIAATPDADKINLSGMLALTNITVAEVTWHHGGGIEVRRCPRNPRECWNAWWQVNKATFKVKEIKQSRRYVNYPNYGIYKQP